MSDVENMRKIIDSIRLDENMSTTHFRMISQAFTKFLLGDADNAINDLTMLRDYALKGSNAVDKNTYRLVQKAMYNALIAIRNNLEQDLDEKKVEAGWNKAEKYTKYDPPNTGNKGVSARRGFVG